MKIKSNSQIRLYLMVVCLLLLVASCARNEQSSDDYQADIIIYGGTSAAVTAAVEAARNGNTVLVVSPDIHLGGLSSGGLGWTDAGKKTTIGGLSWEFYHRVWEHYREDSAWIWQKKEAYGAHDKTRKVSSVDDADQTMWAFEPHVAEQIFDEMLAEHKIEVLRDEWLNREKGVKKEGDKIISITTLSGKTFAGKIFIDATYEGDLLAAADVSYHVGRESTQKYDEKWNGVQTGVLHHLHYFKSPISPYKVPGDSTSGLLPRISAAHPGEFGAGDDKVQAYCFRTCMTDFPENRVPFAKPENYDPNQYELLLRVFNSGVTDIYKYFSKIDPVPNRKTDSNNRGPFSSDNIGMNYDYPEASYKRRKEIIDEHRQYQMGLYWFASQDERVPGIVRNEFKKWGLAKDEFTDNGNWPHQLYIREARRMVSDYVTTEHETLGKREVPRSVGMGSYSMDSHNIQRYVTLEGFVQNEGNIGVHTKPYGISYGALVPKSEECQNLLVPVCVSSSHIAYGSIRMEPVFMILGQSAAAAAKIAIERGIVVQEVPYETLGKMLREKGQVLTMKDMGE